MRALDFSPFLESAIGFDDLFSMTDSLKRFAESDRGYPPYDIQKLSENDYRITMAVAGFTRDDLTVVAEGDVLTVEGRTAGEDESSESEFLHRGIARRAFERRFRLAEFINVKEARFENGLLVIDLEREIPEHKRPRQIDIASDEGRKTISGKKAA